MDDLVAVADQYIQTRVICQDYVQNILRIAKACGKMQAAAVNDYLRQRLQAVSTITARNERTILLCLWRFAYDSGLTDTAPRGIAKIKPRKPPTKAWTVQQLKGALNRAGGLKGRVLRSGVPAGTFLRCWLLLGYESGARRGDVFSFRHDQIDGDVLRWVQSKTGDPLCKVLSRACLDAVAEMRRYGDGEKTILGWAVGRRQSLRVMRQFLDECGIGGSSKWLRRSGATHIEMISPGKAKLHLGHRSVGLAESNYLDWGQIRETTPVTPALVD